MSKARIRPQTVKKKYKPVGVKVKPRAVQGPGLDIKGPTEEEIIERMKERNRREGNRMTEEHLNMIVDNRDGNLRAAEVEFLKGILVENDKAFAFSDDQKGRMDSRIVPPTKIHTIPHIPWKEKNPEYVGKEYEEVVQFFLEKFRNGEFERSNSPYSSRWFIIRKIKNGKPVGLRFIHDVQRLNGVTIRDVSKIPDAYNLVQRCSGRSIMSMLDIYGGYDELPMDPASRPLLAIWTPIGLLQPTMLPQGWTNAVGTFQRGMYICLSGLEDNVEIYLDDIPVLGPREKDESESEVPGVRKFVYLHGLDLDRVLRRLIDVNLTAAGRKSHVGRSKAQVLGFVCREDGTSPDPEKVAAIMNWREDFTSVTDILQFLGLIGRFFRFIPDLATRAEPLRRLTRKGVTWEWGDEERDAVQDLKREFEFGGPVLAVPEFSNLEERPFIVSTDWGPVAAGGYLAQNDLEGNERPISFYSKTHGKHDRGYSQFKGEVKAVAMNLKYFRPYIYSSRFILRIDPTAVAGILNNFSVIDPIVSRWLSYIRLYDFTVERISGKDNSVADALSRLVSKGANVMDDDFLEDAAVSNRIELQKQRTTKDSSGLLGLDSTSSGFGIFSKELFFSKFSSSLYSKFSNRSVLDLCSLAFEELQFLFRKKQKKEKKNKKEEKEKEKEKENNEKQGMNKFEWVDDGKGDTKKLETNVWMFETEDGDVYWVDPEEYPGDYYQYLGEYLETRNFSDYLTDEDKERVLKDAKFFLTRGGKIFTKPRRFGYVPRLVVVRRDIQLRIIEQCHDGIAAGHRGIRTTVERVLKLYWWKYCGKMVEEWVRSCDVCQKSKDGLPIQELHPSEAIGVGWKVHMDSMHIGKSDSGMEKIIGICDDMTGYLDGEAFPTANGTNVIKVIKDFVSRYGCPNVIITDGGPEFKGQEVQEFAESLGIRIRKASAYHPEANSVIERRWREIRKALKRWLQDHMEDWDDYYRYAFLATNTTVNAFTGYTPFELWYGRDCITPVEFTYESWRTVNYRLGMSTEELIIRRAQQIKTAEEHRYRAMDAINEQRERARIRWNRKSNDENLQVGELVLVLNSELMNNLGRRMEFKWNGPYVIVGMSEGGAFYLAEMDGSPIRNPITGARIRRYIDRDLFPDLKVHSLTVDSGMKGAAVEEGSLPSIETRDIWSWMYEVGGLGLL